MSSSIKVGFHPITKQPERIDHHEMKPHLFIHIGTHKTGSTAIQRALKAGEVACLNEGLVRLKCDDLAARQSWNQKERGEQADKLRRQINNHQGKGRRFLISSESFSGDPMTGYADAPAIASRLREVTRDFDVSIIVFLRRQDDFIESLYTQKIHEGRSETFQEFLEEINPEEMNWHRLLENYAGEFGRESIIARRYHRECYPNTEDLLVDFCGMVSVAPGVLKGRLKTVRNQGFSMEAVELARLCNPRMDGRMRRRLRQILQVISAKPVFQSYDYFDRQTRQQLLTFHEESNARVLRDYIYEPNAVSLFPQPDDSASLKRAVEAEALIVVLVKMLLERKEAEDRSGILRFVMRLERRWHEFRQSWLCQEAGDAVILKEDETLACRKLLKARV